MRGQAGDEYDERRTADWRSSARRGAHQAPVTLRRTEQMPSDTRDYRGLHGRRSTRAHALVQVAQVGRIAIHTARPGVKGRRNGLPCGFLR